MKVHLIETYSGESQVLVTGTQDIEAARKAANADRIANEYMEEVTGRAVRGITIPQPSDREFSWVWMERDGGRVKAVVFDD